jgi:CRISPR-associated protein Csm4
VANELAFTLKPQGPFRTLPTASMLFGQLVWAASFAGQDVTQLLEPFRAGNPSFVLSDAFPVGQFPKPILPPAKFAGSTGDSAELSTEKRKALKNALYLEERVWRDSIERGERAIIMGLRPDRTHKVLQEQHLTRVGIDRPTLSARDGLLFSEAAQYLNGSWNIFVRVLEPTAYEKWNVPELLEQIGKSGFGGGASVGRGAFTMLETKTVDLSGPRGANGFTSLSAFVPLELQPEEGYYDLEVYRGRLGGGYNGSDPWKKPYVRAKTGSSFHGDPNKGYGMFVDNLATLHDGIQVGDYAFAFPVGVRLDDASL